jgi:lysozyme
MKLSLRVVALGVVAITAACSASNEDLGSSDEQVTVCGQTTVKGVDVYHGDNGGSAIDWAKVKAAGISFAFAKATESTNFTDSMFATNWAGMKSAGLVRGAYHFFHSDVDPTAQATFFLSTVGTLEKGDLLVLDLETTNNQTQATVLAHAETFMAAVKSKSGVTPILYTSPAFLSSFGTLGQYPLWVANYGVSCPSVPSAWKSYTFWQSTGTGKLSALSGNVDLDTFNGTLADLQSLGSTLLTADAGAQDASTDATSDVTPTDSASAPDATEPAEVPPGGCACTLGATSHDSRWAFLLAGLVLLRRRHRRGHIANTNTRGARESAASSFAG